MPFKLGENFETIRIPICSIGLEYLPTFGLNLLVNVGKYSKHGARIFLAISFVSLWSDFSLGGLPSCTISLRHRLFKVCKASSNLVGGLETPQIFQSSLNQNRFSRIHIKSKPTNFLWTNHQHVTNTVMSKGSVSRDLDMLHFIWNQWVQTPFTLQHTPFYAFRNIFLQLLT